MLSKRLRETVWYHGTPSLRSAQQIIKNGIVPLTGKRRSDKTGEPPSRRGRVYLTSDVSTAAGYAGPSGYVFVVPGSNLVEIEPDEDALLLLSISAMNDRSANMRDLQKLLRSRDSSSDSFFSDAIPEMNQKMIEWIVSMTSTLAHVGPVCPTHVYKIDGKKMTKQKYVAKLTASKPVAIDPACTGDYRGP